MSSDNPDWRRFLVARLRERNKKEIETYKDIIGQNNRLIDSVSQLKNENFRISIENERIRTTGGVASGDSAKVNNQIAGLEKKLLTQQEELMDLHRRKGENTQLIVDLNVKVDKQNTLLREKDEKLALQNSMIVNLKADLSRLNSSMDNLKTLDEMLRDEHTALQLAFSSLEDKLRHSQDENRALVERIIKFKSKDAEELNRENESFLKKRSDKVRRDLEDASRESRNSISPVNLPGAPVSDCESICEDSISLGAPTSLSGFYSDSLPTTIHLKFEAHDGEVNAVRWSPANRLVATGGADRKVKLWDVGKRNLELRGVLVGNNAGINSIDFDSTGSFVLGTSNDYAIRVWSAADHRLRHTLTGHSAKVMAAKFLQEPSKVVTGSHDRTLKIWDLRSKACIETKFAGSSCNDLVTTDSSGSTIISGHFDKKIRFWDTRTDNSANDIVMAAKITSLDLSKDCSYLLCCVRDDTIKLLDLRMNQVVGNFADEGFKVSCDWARVAFSSNGSRVAAGSADGSIFVWNVHGHLETILKGHEPEPGISYFRSAAVNAVSWHPTSSVLASVGKGKKCIIWVDG